jgi:hypothetical protein
MSSNEAKQVDHRHVSGSVSGSRGEVDIEEGAAADNNNGKEGGDNSNIPGNIASSSFLSSSSLKKNVIVKTGARSDDGNGKVDVMDYDESSTIFSVPPKSADANPPPPPLQPLSSSDRMKEPLAVPTTDFGRNISNGSNNSNGSHTGSRFGSVRMPPLLEQFLYDSLISGPHDEVVTDVSGTTSDDDAAAAVNAAASLGTVVFESTYDMTEERLRRLFELFDSDHNGRVSYDELRRGIMYQTQSGVVLDNIMDDASFRNMISYLDTVRENLCSVLLCMISLAKRKAT